MKIKYLEHTHNYKYKKTKYDNKFISDMSVKFPYANIRIIPYWYKFEIDGEIYYSSQVYRKVGSLDKYRETKYANMMKKAEEHCIKQANNKSNYKNDDVVIHDTWEQKVAYDNYGERTPRQF